MTAAQTIEAALRGAAGWGDSDRVDRLLADHRSETIGDAIAHLYAIPIQCTALTGPIWYGAGWKDCITQLEEIADYRLPDGEAYPGELLRLRARMRELRAAALRNEDLPRVQQILTTHAAYETEARSEKAAPDFFQADRTYTRPHHSETITFVVEAVSTSPDGRTPLAHGWRTTPYTGSGWEPTTADDFTGWTEAPEAVTA